MSDVTLGKLVEGNPGRDAIHLAVVPVVAGEWLQPGDPVAIVDGIATKPRKGVPSPIGIVDPFLEFAVEKGQSFWLCLYPKTITSLRHVWEHPSLPSTDLAAQPTPSDEVKASLRWLESYVRRNCPYWAEGVSDEPPQPDGGLSRFLKLVKHDRQIFYYGSDCHGLYDVEEPDELFRHLSIILGKKIDAEYFEAFTCSC